MHHLTDVIKRLEREIPQSMEQYQIPGLAIGICDAHRVLWSAAFGTTQRDNGHPVTVETTFSIQSCSKMYTALTVLLAVQEGLVDLHEPITTYLPEFSVHSRFERRPESKITLGHLLTHTAGFTHEAPVGSNYEVGSPSFIKHCRSIADTWLRFPVGHHHEYSNLGCDLAAYIIQTVSGRPFHRFVERHLLRPLEMRRSTLDYDRICRDPNRAVGHSKQLGKRLPTRIPMVGAGGVYTSIQDACRFLQFHLAAGGSLIDSDLLAQMSRHENGCATGYGAGLASIRVDGSLVHGHGGGGFGFLSDMYWMPHKGFGVAMLTNSVDHPLQGKVVMGIMKELATSRFNPPPLPPATKPAETALAPLYGEYVGRGGTKAGFRKGRTGPVFEIDGDRKDIRFVDDRTFVVNDEHRETYRFLVDDTDGGLIYLQSVDSGFVRYRNDVPTTSRNSLERTAGPWNRSYTIKVNGIPVQVVDLVRDDDIFIVRERDAAPLRLRPFAAGMYFSSTGEVLDLTGEIPTYANIKLHPIA